MGENAQWVNGARLQASTGCKYVTFGRRAEGNMRVKKRCRAPDSTVARVSMLCDFHCLKHFS